MINLNQISNIETLIREFTLEGVQSGDKLAEYGMELTAHLSWTGEQQSIAKKIWREAQRKAYETFVFSKMANGMEIKPLMAKDYVAARCSEEEANYERVERCVKSITHTIDFIRSVMATLRLEREAENYQSSFQK